MDAQVSELTQEFSIEGGPPPELRLKVAAATVFFGTRLASAGLTPADERPDPLTDPDSAACEMLAADRESVDDQAARQMLPTGVDDDRKARRPDAAQLDDPASDPNSTAAFAPSPPTVVSILGPDPYAAARALRALMAGQSLREVDKALSKLMSRRQARTLIHAAKAMAELDQTARRQSSKGHNQ